MRGYTKSHYLTVRCQPCECWLHPRAVAAHSQRCAGRRWDDGVGATTLIDEDLGQLFAQVLPPELVGRPTFSDDRILSPGPGEYLHPGVCHGIVVASPIDGVPARVWARVATAAARRLGETGVRACLHAEGLARMRRELEVEITACPDCGEVVSPRALGSHRATSSLCRWRRAVAEVRRRWDEGFRDPWSVPGAPLDWTGLNARVAWRRRLHVVEFARWAAVLLAHDDAAGARTPERSSVESAGH